MRNVPLDSVSCLLVKHIGEGYNFRVEGFDKILLLFLLKLMIFSVLQVSPSTLKLHFFWLFHKFL